MLHHFLKKTVPQRPFVQKNKRRFASLFNQALKLSEWRAFDVAVPLYHAALSIDPDKDFVHFKLAEAYHHLNQRDNAITHYKACLNINPDDPFGVQIKLFLLGDIDHLNDLPRAYIQNLFDQYAPYYDNSLTKNLNYDVPAQVAKIVNKTPDISTDTILDLGCGTGLSAAPYKGKASVIHGVDVSRDMLNQAVTKNIYDDVFCMGIHHFLQKYAQTYDLILSLEVFLYLGDLKKIFMQIHTHLNATGTFVFTVQAKNGKGFHLGQDHRYAHSHRYVEDVLNETHLSILQSENVILRTEHHEPVDGIIFICQKQS